jgi:hypothetical protein
MDFLGVLHWHSDGIFSFVSSKMGSEIPIIRYRSHTIEYRKVIIIVGNNEFLEGLYKMICKNVSYLRRPQACLHKDIKVNNIDDNFQCPDDKMLGYRTSVVPMNTDSTNRAYHHPVF